MNRTLTFASPQEPQATPQALERLVVYGNPSKAGISAVLQKLAVWAHERGIALWVEQGIIQVAEQAGLLRCDVGGAPRAGSGEALQCIRPFAAEAEREQALDPAVKVLVLCLGGDGTLIHAVHRLWPLTPPVMAVHLGSLSFNATVEAAQVTQGIEAWMAGRAKLTPRMVLQVRLFAGTEHVAEYVAMNDVVLSKRSEARLINLTLHQGEERVLEFAGDGIIVSTPTGSTAYNLSAGGPIVFPSLEAMIATAICPHTLAARPVVLPPRPVVTMEYHPHTQREQAMVWVDGQECRPAEPGDRIEMEGASMPLWLVHLPGAHYFSRLRRKLLWSGHLSPSVADEEPLSGGESLDGRASARP